MLILICALFHSKFASYALLIELKELQYAINNDVNLNNNL